MLRIDSPAPDFELQLHNGLRFRLSDQTGQKYVILYFYPRDFTWGCTKEGCLFADHILEIESLDAVLIGINNESVEQHRKFAEKYRFPFALASDPHLEVCHNYRASWLGGKAIRRVTYIINKNRMIKGIAHHELLIDRHWKHVKRVLVRLREDEALRTYNRKAWNL